jgi:hypothetical protein
LFAFSASLYLCIELYEREQIDLYPNYADRHTSAIYSPHSIPETVLLCVLQTTLVPVYAAATAAKFDNLTASVYMHSDYGKGPGVYDGRALG